MSSTCMPPPPAPLAHRRTRPTTARLPPSPPYSPESSCTLRNMSSLSKGATFHVSSSPPTKDDPVLSIRHLARRSPTSPRSSLQSLICDREDVALRSIQAFEHSFSGARGKRLSTHRLSETEQLKIHRAVSSPVDEGLGSSISSDKGLARSFDRILGFEDRDSGLGSSIETSEEDGLARDLIQDTNELISAPEHIKARQGGTRQNLKAPSSNRPAVTSSISPPTTLPTRRGPRLSNFARKNITQNILDPLLQESRFEFFHPLVNSLGSRSNKSIRCLRDLEQSLIFQPLTLPVPRHLYRTFGELSIQLVLDTYQHLSEVDQRREADRPYNSGYFLDLVQQVGRLAAQIGARDNNNNVTINDDMTYSTDDEVTVEGGLAQTGQIAELVRWKNGKGISLRTNQPYEPAPGIKRQHSSETLDDEAARSMARRKKNEIPKVVHLKCGDKECDKTFTRPCDLAKHEKTHSRPFKCPEPTCKYHDMGLPTEKERDRHINDKHDPNPLFYNCKFCEFKTKRESNCKQHMEKKHDWSYKRVKGKKGEKERSGSVVGTPITPSISHTPSEHSPATWDDASSVNGSIADSTMVSPYDQPLNTFDNFNYTSPTSLPLFPRADQLQFVQANPNFGFETTTQHQTRQGYNSYQRYTPALETSMSPHTGRTPMTPAYSAISSYGPSPQILSIQMDYTRGWNQTGLPTPSSNFLQPHSNDPSISNGSPMTQCPPEQSYVDYGDANVAGTGMMHHDPFVSHSQLPNTDDFSFNDPVITSTTGYHQGDAAMYDHESGLFGNDLTDNGGGIENCDNFDMSAYFNFPGTN